jgi:hypothetical protein
MKMYGYFIGYNLETGKGDSMYSIKQLDLYAQDS